MCVRRAIGIDTVRKRIMGKSHLNLVAPNTANRTIAMPTRKPNAELRTREYLTDAEVARLMNVAKDNRDGHRDATMIVLAYRHGFRVRQRIWKRSWYGPWPLTESHLLQPRPAAARRRSSGWQALRCNSSGSHDWVMRAVRARETHVSASCGGPDSLYLKTDISPEDLFIAIGKLRLEARREINRLIQFLDKTDDYVSRAAG
jgi:hypothetical protein